MQRAAPKPHGGSSTAPPFGRLVAAALRSVGVEYVTLDHLRRAKKNALSERERAELWQLLHDLVVVVLLDFELDVDAFRAEHEVFDESKLPLWQEIARFYLYERGFVCRNFYDSAVATPAAVLLLAVAWLLANSRFFERQQSAILQIYLNSSAPRLPPFPNQVAVPPSSVVDAVKKVSEDTQQLLSRIQSDLDPTARLNQLQALVGRIYAHHRALHTSLQDTERMLAQLEQKQREAGAVEPDEFIPAYALQVFAKGKRDVDLHVCVLTERLQMIEDEKLFYKWINGVLLQVEPSDRPGLQVDLSDVLESNHSDLYTDILQAQRSLQRSAELCQQIATLFTSEKKKWQQKTKTKTQQVKMEEKMEKLTLEIATKELPNVQTLFVDRDTAPVAKAGKKQPPVVQVADLDRLQSQLEKVMQEITTEYCRVQLI